jgi:hypothetical protein
MAHLISSQFEQFTFASVESGEKLTVKLHFHSPFVAMCRNIQRSRVNPRFQKKRREGTLRRNEHLHHTRGVATHLTLAQELSKGPDENLGLAHYIRDTTLPSEYRALASEQIYPEVEQGDSIC